MSLYAVCAILQISGFPKRYAGSPRLFDNMAIAQVRYELNAIDTRRRGRR